MPGTCYYNYLMVHLQEKPNLWRQLRAAYLLWRAKVRRHYAIVLASPGEYARAVKCYSHAIALNPALGVAYLERGVLLWRELHQTANAITDFNNALKLQPDWPEALFCRGLAYQTMGEYQAAAQDLDAYLKTDDRVWQAQATRQLALTRSLLHDAEPVEDDQT